MAYQLDASGHRGSAAVQRLVELVPATGSLALWMQHRDVDILPGAESAWQDGPIANDGQTIFYTAAFDKLPAARQLGLLAHQILHVVLQHEPRRQALSAAQGEVDPVLFNACADALVNSALSHLDWLDLPKRAIMLDTLLSRVLGIEETLAVSLQRWDSESLYRAIDDRQHSANRSREQRSGSSGDSDENARHTESATHSQTLQDGPQTRRLRNLHDASQRDLVEGDGPDPDKALDARRQWSDRLLRAHTADGEHSLLRQLLADGAEPRTPWQHVLRTQLNRSLAPLPELNWSRPSRAWLANRGRTRSGRRMPWEPGISSSRQVPRLVVLVDVSGSVDAPLLSRFAGEIERIIRLHRAPTRLITGDTAVREDTVLTPGSRSLRDIPFSGGGGTNLNPMLERADRYQPDLGVFLTDLQGPADVIPRWPLIWAVPAAFADVALPCGSRLVLD